MKAVVKWMKENNVHRDPKRLEFPSIGHLLSKFADDHSISPINQKDKRNRL